MVSAKSVSVITARKRSFAKVRAEPEGGGVHGRGTSVAGGLHGGGCAWQGACVAGGVHGGGHVWWGGHVWHACPPPKILRDTVNERAVHILLECILGCLLF